MKILVVLLMIFLSGIAGAAEPAADGQQQRLERQLLDRNLTAGEVERMLVAMTAAGFSREEMERLGERLAAGDQALRQAALDKIREGVAKGAPPQAILAATEKVRNRLEIAMQLATSLQRRNDQVIVEALADGLAAGLHQEQAAHLTKALTTTKASGDEARDLTAETLLYARDMARRRVASTAVVEVLTSLLAQGVSAHDMQQLRQSYATGASDPEQQMKRMGQNAIRGNQTGGQHGEASSMDMGGAGQVGPGDDGSGGGGSGGGGGGGGGRR